MYAIEFNHVKKQLGNFKLDIPSLDIKQGYITGFVGENGAGKTTTIRLIMDMLIADQGKIQVLGMDTREKSDLVKEHIGYVGDPMGYPEESRLKDIKRMLAPFYKTWDETLYNRYIRSFAIDLNKKYTDLSAGQKKQFALIMALSHRPKLILLDEPTVNLDPVVRNEILDILMEHMQNEEVSVFYSTHITTDLEKAADYIVYIKEGKIMLNQEKQQLVTEYCIVKGPKSLLEKDTKKHLIGFRKTSLGFEALAVGRKHIQEIFGEEVKYVTPTIEEIMLFLSEKKGVQ
ncbi:ABC transporter ATP-binding protein [Cellulosilyticum sp. I15G10I2]|uniref:ABC transporter ATP-binding protein n=1 Tax=Cellulosilyticum sp. I15G10I2 TaxID=1892843 RepID=UPI00085C5B9B|nr:ABC transporter ATP-binding protein [Cellulosilyticum sp. I15G10I2]